jgi:hypothetical protein
MKKSTIININAAIALEYSLAKLYAYYSERFPAEKNFWNQLQVEEINHASLLKTVKDFARIEKIPEGIVMDSPESYHNTIRTIENSLNVECIPDLNAAFEFAYSLEKTSGEIHFQNALNKEDPDPVTRIFIKLNGMDLNHATRILEHWKTTVLEQ